MTPYYCNEYSCSHLNLVYFSYVSGKFIENQSDTRQTWKALRPVSWEMLFTTDHYIVILAPPYKTTGL